MKRMFAFTSREAQTMRVFISGIIIAAMALLVFVASESRAITQSKSRDNPTPLTSSEISKYLDRKSDSSVAGYDYYTFSAGPGEVVITLNVQELAEMGAGVNFTIFDDDAMEVTKGDVGADSGRDEQTIKRITLSKKQTLLLRIGVRSQYAKAGKYRLRLSGAIDLGQGKPGPSLDCLPRQGTLVLKMSDGSTQKIDLNKVQEKAIEP